MVLALGLLAGCLDRPGERISIATAPGVEQTLAGWSGAGIKCKDPELGWPGPALDWHCPATVAGVDVRVRLIADRIGVQSIHIGVRSATPRVDAAHAFAAVVEATPPIEAARAEIVEWLLVNDAADGEMPLASPPTIGRVAVDSTEPGVIMLYVIPMGSSMLSAGNNTLRGS